MGWKDWVYGDLVSAADFQSLVQDQTVQRYASSSARSAALGSAVAEGMVSYLDDTNSVEVYSGSGWDVIRNGSGNVILNSSFDIWQRGTSVTLTGGAYAVDRYGFIFDGTQSVTTSRQDFTPGNTISGYEAPYYARIAVASTSSGQSYNQFGQPIEDVRTFAGQTMTFSFWAKATSGSFTVTPRYIQYFGSGGSSQVEANFGSTITLTTSWVRYTQTVTLPSISGKTIGTANSLKIVLDLPKNTTWSLDTWGWQVEAGSSATAFKRNAPSIQGELAACQRYLHATGGTLYEYHAVMDARTSTLAQGVVYLKNTLRTAVSSIEYSNLELFDPITNGHYAVTAMGLDYAGSGQAPVSITATVSSGLTSSRTYYLISSNNASGYFRLPAEL